MTETHEEASRQLQKRVINKGIFGILTILGYFHTSLTNIDSIKFYKIKLATNFL